VNIIFVSDNPARNRSISLGRNQVVLLMLALASLPILSAISLYYFTLSHNNVLPRQVQSQNNVFMQENLNAMAVRLGQLQAKVLRLDALGGRLAKHFGLPEQEFNFRQQPGQGGAESSAASRQLSAQELERELARFALLLETRTDGLGVLEALTLREQVKKSAFPSLAPLSVGWFSSNFGLRIDPFSGKQSLHEGVDFTADAGTPIRAAAGGVVVYSDYHHQYGNMIVIEHGNGLSTRYAHASKRLVKVGDIVLQGQKIGAVGSTGRSTGSHLHFEVLNNGAPQNPANYLQVAG
jgi:murein DD-endopeptidase MepM/ murein hydrolase activator NlpD